MIQAIAQRPWSGWGILQVPEALNSLADKYEASEAFTYSHNVLLDLAVELGLPIAILFYVGAAAWLWRRVQATKQLLPWYCLAVVVPLAVHSLLEFPFAYAYFLVPTMLILGVLERTLGNTRPLVNLKAWHAVVILCLVTIAMARSVVEYIEIEEDLRFVRLEAFRIGKIPSSHHKPNIILLTQLDVLLQGGRIAPNPTMTAVELTQSRKAALRYPWPAMQNRYALSLALNGDPTEAARQLRVLRAMYGDVTYAEIKSNWSYLAQYKYPQLAGFQFR